MGIFIGIFILALVFGGVILYGKYSKPNTDAMIDESRDENTDDNYADVYIVSFIVPLVGFIVGSIKLASKDRKDRKIGCGCVFLGALSTILLSIFCCKLIINETFKGKGMLKNQMIFQHPY